MTGIYLPRVLVLLPQYKGLLEMMSLSLKILVHGIPFRPSERVKFLVILEADLMKALQIFRLLMEVSPPTTDMMELI